NFGGNIPVADFPAFAQSRLSQSQSHLIVCHIHSSRGFGYAVRREIFLQTWTRPLALEHERRSHDRSAPAIEPLVLRMRSWKTGFIHQSNLPLEFDLALVTILQLSPGRFGPITPRRDNIQ